MAAPSYVLIIVVVREEQKSNCISVWIDMELTIEKAQYLNTEWDVEKTVGL